MTLEPIRNALLSAKHRQEQGEKHTRYEMGQMLIHAKSLCAHGEWYPFLDEAEISKSTANELMDWANYWQIAATAEVFQLEPSSASESVDQIAATAEVSLPTARAQREFLRAEPEVKEVIIEKMVADPQAEIKAAEIRRLRKENDELIRRVGAAETNNIRETVIDSSIIASSAGLLSDLASGMVDEYFHERLQPAQQQRLLQTLQDIVNYSQAFIERNSLQNITTQIIDV